MAMFTRKVTEQPVLLQVELGKSPIVIERPRPMAATPYWVAVSVTAAAKERIEELQSLFSDTETAVQQTVSSLLEAVRTKQMKNFAGFGETQLAKCGNVPHDVRILFQYSESQLVIVDVRRPDQPALFGY